jgi:hypothetical protein
MIGLAPKNLSKGGKSLFKWGITATKAHCRCRREKRDQTDPPSIIMNLWGSMTTCLKVILGPFQVSTQLNKNKNCTFCQKSGLKTNRTSMCRRANKCSRSWALSNLAWNLTNKSSLLMANFSKVHLYSHLISIKRQYLTIILKGKISKR